MKTATIFPVEIDVEVLKPQVCLFKNRLRPEFLCMIDSFLSNGAFLNEKSLINSDVISTTANSFGLIKLIILIFVFIK